MDRLQVEFKATKSVLQQQLSQAREELEKDLELEKKDSKLQSASKALKAANRLAEGVKAELDRDRIVFQGEKDRVLCELEQALVSKVEAEKKEDEDEVMAKL